MIPVDQTMFYDPSVGTEGQRGNCLQAVLASMLEMPLDDVPHVVGDHVEHDGDHNLDWHWDLRQKRWLADRGFRMSQTPPLPGEYVMATGPSPRGQGLYHIVIYQDGALAHDPHPDRSGILSVTRVERLLPLGLS